MRTSRTVVLLIAALFLLLGACTKPATKEQAMKYPKKPADNPERKSGLPMLFYEAAEEDADIYDVTVTPPAEKKEQP